MLRRFQFVRVLKWAGTLACLFILAAFITSVWYSVTWSPIRGYSISLFGGTVDATRDRDESPIFESRIEWHPDHFTLWDFRLRSWSSWPRITFLVIPLWLPLLIVLAPTFLLWRLDRRVPPGHCRKCRYDMTGNTTGRCPECSAAFAPAAR